jgi:large subunit ribosomal protein L29
MKPTELRQQSLPELEKQLHELLKEQFALRMQKGSDQLNRPSQFKVVRRNIARVKTLMAEKQVGSRA